MHKNQPAASIKLIKLCVGHLWVYAAKKEDQEQCPMRLQENDSFSGVWNGWHRSFWPMLPISSMTSYYIVALTTLSCHWPWIHSNHTLLELSMQWTHWKINNIPMLALLFFLKCCEAAVEGRISYMNVSSHMEVEWMTFDGVQTFRIGRPSNGFKSCVRETFERRSTHLV